MHGICFKSRTFVARQIVAFREKKRDIARTVDKFTMTSLIIISDHKMIVFTHRFMSLHNAKHSNNYIHLIIDVVKKRGFSAGKHDITQIILDVFVK